MNQKEKEESLAHYYLDKRHKGDQFIKKASEILDDYLKKSKINGKRRESTEKQ